jgi:hypothetical protein
MFSKIGRDDVDVCSKVDGRKTNLSPLIKEQQNAIVSISV